MADDKIDYIKEQIEGSSWLYNLPTKQNNLFILREFYDPYEGVPESGIEDLKFRLRKFDSVSNNLSADSNSLKAFRETTVSDIVQKKETNVEWIDDRHHTVERLHQNWLRSWYNPEQDCMVIGPKGKFRNIVIDLFCVDGEVKSFGKPTMVGYKVATFTFRGCIPVVPTEETYKWGESGSGNTYNVKYAFQKCEVKWENDDRMVNFASKYGRDIVFKSENNEIASIINNEDPDNKGVYSI